MTQLKNLLPKPLKINLQELAKFLHFIKLNDVNYNKLFTQGKDIEAITPADVQRVAAKYFTQNNRTVATLIPEAK